jgi:hypothetical protein
MNKNYQIESLNRELKQVIAEISRESCPKRKADLETYCQEIKANIIDLASESEVDYTFMANAMFFKALANTLLHKVHKMPELKTIISQLLELGVPNETLTGEKEGVTDYLRSIGYDNPTKFERYHELIRVVRSKTFKNNHENRQNLMKDYNWLMEKDSVAAQTMHILGLDSKKLNEVIQDEDFETLVNRYNHLVSV